MYRTLNEKGIFPDVVFADKRGVAEYRYLRNWIDRKEFIKSIEESFDSKVSDYNKLVSEIRQYAENSIVVFDFSHDNNLKEEIRGGHIILLNLFDETDFQTILGMHSSSESIFSFDLITSTDKIVNENSESVNIIAAKSAEKPTIEKSQEQIETEHFLETVWSGALGI